MNDGYAIFPGALSTDEVASVRAAVTEYFKVGGNLYDYGMTQPDAFSLVPSIRWLITHDAIVDAVKLCAGRDDVQFTFQSDCHMNMLSGWHTDTGAYFTREEVSPDDFQVFKVGIYLQDHFDNAQGLTVSPGSHLPPNLRNPSVTSPVKTRAGDIIVFDTRIWHVGDQKKLHEKIFGKLVRSEKVKYAAGGLFRRLTGRVEKVSVFFSYGVPNAHTLAFAQRTTQRQDRQNGVKVSQQPEALIKELRARGMPFVNLENASVC